MSVKEYEKLSAVAKRLGISRRAVYYWAQQGTLPGAIQINGTWLIRIADLNQHLARLHAARGEYVEPQTQLSKPLSQKRESELTAFHRRMTEYLIKPYRFSRPMSELRQAMEDGTATDAEIAEVRTWDFWRAWDIEKLTLSPALRERFNKRAITAEDLAAIRLKVSRSRRS